MLDIQVGARCTDIIRPENAVRLTPTRHGPELWVWNNARVDEGELADSVPLYGRTVPEHLAARIQFAPRTIYRDAAIANATDEFRLPRGARAGTPRVRPRRAHPRRSCFPPGALHRRASPARTSMRSEQQSVRDARRNLRAPGHARTSRTRGPRAPSALSAPAQLACPRSSEPDDCLTPV